MKTHKKYRVVVGRQVVGSFDYERLAENFLAKLLRQPGANKKLRIKIK